MKFLIKTMKDGYFADRNYVLIYMHHLFVSIAYAAMYIFTGAFFLGQGMPLHFVLLFYGLEYGLRGVLCPYGLMVFNRFGVFRSLAISIFFKILFFVGVALAEYNLWLGFASFIVVALSGAIYYPFLDVLEAIYIKEDQNRARQLSLGLVSKSIGKIIGSAGVGFILVHFGFEAVVIFIAVTLILAVLPFIWVDRHNVGISNYKPADSFQFLVSPDFRPLWPLFLAKQLYIIVRSVIIPIFIYSIVEDIELLGYLVALTILVEKAMTLLAGHYTDRLGVQNSMNIISVSYPLSMLGFIFLAKTPFSILLVESFHKINSNFFTSTFMSALHGYGRKNFKDKIMLYGAGWQMMLCFGELIFLPFYGFLAYFIGEAVFYIAFVFAAVGVLVVRQRFRKGTEILALSSSS